MALTLIAEIETILGRQLTPEERRRAELAEQLLAEEMGFGMNDKLQVSEFGGVCEG